MSTACRVGHIIREKQEWPGWARPRYQQGHADRLGMSLQTTMQLAAPRSGPGDAGKPRLNRVIAKIWARFGRSICRLPLKETSRSSTAAICRRQHGTEYGLDLYADCGRCYRSVVESPSAKGTMVTTLFCFVSSDSNSDGGLLNLRVTLAAGEFPPISSLSAVTRTGQTYGVYPMFLGSAPPVR